MNDRISLCDLITSKFGFERGTDSFYEIYAHTLSYLTRGIGYSEYQERLKPFCRTKQFSAKTFRLMLHTSEYHSLVVKLYCLRLGKRARITQDHAKEFAREYGMFKDDARWIYRFWQDQRKFRARLKAEASKFDEKSHLNLEVLRAALNQVAGPVLKFAKSYTYKKLRFICKSQNEDFSAMHAELTIKMVSAYYKLMPCTHEPLHVINYLKLSIRNAGVNIISANTSLKAGRLVNNDATGKTRDSFSLLVVSENQMRLVAGEDPVSYEELAGHNPMEQVETEHTVGQLMSTVKKGGKKHRFLTILMGVDDPEFTAWLQHRNYCTDKESNSDLQMRIDPTRFNILLGRFLKVDSARVTSFLGKLRSSLEPDTTSPAATQPTAAPALAA